MGSITVYGGRPLRGTVKISGAKNAALPILAASLLSSEKVILRNIPDLTDVQTMIEILRAVGSNISFKDGCVEIEPPLNPNTSVPYELVRKMRASFNVLGPLAATYGDAVVSLPGGCSIGVRPVNYHITGLETLGFKIDIAHGFVRASLKEKKEEVVISLPFPSVGATEHIMTAAAVIEDLHTVIENAAAEPEVEDLGNFLNAMGCRVIGAGTRHIEIFGTREILPCDYTIIPDRIEAGTYAVAAAATRGHVEISNVEAKHLSAFISVLKETGTKLEIVKPRTIVVSMEDRPANVRVTVEPYPGFPTDLQPQMIAFLSISQGTSVVTETVFKMRFHHVDELKRMGANIELTNGTAIIQGVSKLSGADVNATDLRAAAALVIAGLMAEGKTVVHDVDQIFRGYEKIMEKLSALGAEISYEK